MTFYLRHIQGSKRGRVTSHVQNRIRIGRSPDNDMCMDPDRDEEVSAHHAAIFKEGDHFLLEDLDSTNGTFLNGRRITDPVVVSDGDELEFAAGGPRVIFSTKAFPPDESLRATVAVSQYTTDAEGLSPNHRIGARTAMFMRELYDTSADTIKRLRVAILSVAVVLGFVATGLIIGNFRQRNEIVSLAQRANEIQAANSSLEQSRLALLQEGRALEEKISRQAEALKRLEGLVQKLAGGGIESRVTEQGDISVSLPNVNFQFDDAALTPDGLEKVSYIASLLKGDDNDRVILVQGHASLEPGGNEARNAELARQRTEAVTAAFLAAGIASKRLRSQSFGSSRPVASNDTEEGRRQNRRVEVILAAPGTPAEVAIARAAAPEKRRPRISSNESPKPPSQPVSVARRDSATESPPADEMEKIQATVPVEQILDSVFEK